MTVYIADIPRLSWFTPEECKQMILEADQNAKIYNGNFFSILESLAFMHSITEGKKPL
jgi:hypothetical protein